MRGQYILDDDGTPVPEPNCFRWAMFMALDERRVVARDYVHGIKISTIFLGLDVTADIFETKPQLWETMVFGGERDSYQRRYESLEEARAGHAAAVRMVKAEWN